MPQASSQQAKHRPPNLMQMMALTARGKVKAVHEIIFESDG